MRIYIRENVLRHLKESIEEVTFFAFYRDIKIFLKNLLNSPFDVELNGVLKECNVTTKQMIQIMLERNIIKKKERIDEPFDEVLGKKKSTYYVSYLIPKNNFKEKIKKLFLHFFKNN